MPRLVVLLVALALASGADAHASRDRRKVRRAVATVATAAALALPTGAATSMPAPDTPPRPAPAATSTITITSTITSTSTSTIKRPGTSPSTDSTPPVHVRSGQRIASGADPSILTIPSGPDAGHYLVTTGNLSVRRSDDLVHWKKAGALFKGHRLPRGAVSDFWAPSLSTDGKRFYLRYTARGADGILRVRSAVARKVTGPYRDLGPTVAHTPGTSVGDIDASELIDVDGSRWLMWKHDGNSAGQPTPMYIQRLGARGKQLVGKRYLLATNDQAWEGISTEAPSGIRHGDDIVVSYAGSMYGTPDYNVGMLRIHAPRGLRAALASGARFVKHDGPVARSTSATHVGLGHGDFVLGGRYFVSHGWQRGKIQVTPREVVIRKVTWKKGWPRIQSGRPRGARR